MDIFRGNDAVWTWRQYVGICRHSCPESSPPCGWCIGRGDSLCHFGFADSFWFMSPCLEEIIEFMEERLNEPPDTALEPRQRPELQICRRGLIR